ncbi:MAG: hypothetical protein IBX58_11665 [Roseovarius sp.]|nr:hypothetical protein [Roseovarius sp.]
MSRLRTITALGLCLFLALTSVGQAVARGAPQPAGHLVLCIGDGTKTVPVDARGVPMATPHACPDCLLALHATAPQDPLPVPQDAATTARHPFEGARHAAGPALPLKQARAPPRPD